MPVKDRAAYMREYRRRQKLKARGFDVSGDVVLTIDMPGGGRDEYRAKDEAGLIHALAVKITSLEAEILVLERAIDRSERYPGPDPRCDIVRNGDQFVCRIHHRYWQTGICPGLSQPPPSH